MHVSDYFKCTAVPTFVEKHGFLSAVVGGRESHVGTLIRNLIEQIKAFLSVSFALLAATLYKINESKHWRLIIINTFVENSYFLQNSSNFIGTVYVL